MRMRDWGDLAAGIFVLAVIGLLVRPNSLGPGFVRSLGEAMVALVSFVADPQQAGAAAPAAPGGTVYA